MTTIFMLILIIVVILAITRIFMSRKITNPEEPIVPSDWTGDTPLFEGVPIVKKMPTQRYMPITKKTIVLKCGLTPSEFEKAFIDGDVRNSNATVIKCIAIEIKNIVLDYRDKAIEPIYLMCTKKDLAAKLGVSTTSLNKYFKGDTLSLNSEIEKLLEYDDQWNIFKLRLPT